MDYIRIFALLRLILACHATADSSTTGSLSSSSSSSFTCIIFSFTCRLFSTGCSSPARYLRRFNSSRTIAIFSSSFPLTSSYLLSLVRKSSYQGQKSHRPYQSLAQSQFRNSAIQNQHTPNAKNDCLRILAQILS